MNVTEAMIYCYEEPDMVHILLEKATDFIIAYCRAYKAVEGCRRGDRPSLWPGCCPPPWRRSFPGLM